MLSAPVGSLRDLTGVQDVPAFLSSGDRVVLRAPDSCQRTSTFRLPVPRSQVAGEEAERGVRPVDAHRGADALAPGAGRQRCAVAGEPTKNDSLPATTRAPPLRLQPERALEVAARRQGVERAVLPGQEDLTERRRDADGRRGQWPRRPGAAAVRRARRWRRRGRGRGAGVGRGQRACFQNLRGSDGDRAAVRGLTTQAAGRSRAIPGFASRASRSGLP